MVSHLHGRNRSKRMTDEQTESLARARGKHPEQASEKEELELLDEEFLDDMSRNQRGHQRGNGKNQGKEESDRSFGYGARSPGNPL